MFRVRFIESRGITAVLVKACKNFNIGMHSDAYELMIDAIELGIWMLVQVSLTLIQGQRVVRK